MDYPWRNSVLIEKAGDPKISQLNIPEGWTPPQFKRVEKHFEDVYNPGKWSRFYNCPYFKKN